jgi:hypothetical protein
MTPVLEQSSEQLTEIGAAMLRAAPPGWQLLRLSATGAAGMIGTDLEIDMEDGSTDLSNTIEPAGRIACDRLRAEMYQPGKGTWYNASFVVDPDSRIEAEFDYDGWPFGEQATDDLLREDQEVFPRENDLLADWHPTKVVAN